MEHISIKTFALAAVKPLIMSLKRYTEDREAYIKKLVAEQTKAIHQNEALIAELDKKLLTLISKIDKYNQEVAKLSTSLYTMEDVADLKQRSKEVDYILSNVYDVVYAKMPDAKLPNINNPDMPDTNSSNP